MFDKHGQSHVSFQYIFVSSLIPAGWCEEGHPTTKNSLQHSHGYTHNYLQYLVVTKQDFLKWEHHYD